MARTNVELVEDDESLRPPDERRPGVLDVVRRHPRRALVGGLVALAVLATALAGQAVVDARERARLARLADVPGVLRPVEAPMRSQFVAEGDAGAAVQQGVLVGQHFVAGTYAPAQSAPHVLAVDRSTGAQVWEVAVDLPPAPAPEPDVQSDSGASGNAWCSKVDGTPARVSCVVSRSYGWQTENGRSGHEVAVRGLVVLDATDGAVLARRDEPLGADIAQGGDGYWVTTIDADRGGVGIVARSYDGAQRWASHVDVPSPVPSDVVPVVLHDDRRTVLAVGTRAWLLGPDGSTLAELGRGSGQAGVSLVPGAVLIQAYDDTDGRLQDSALWREDGTTTDLGDAQALWLGVDDGSRPGALFTVADSIGPLVRLDEHGAELWRADVTVGYNAMLLDGTVVVAGGDSLAAVDADTGDVRWKTTVPTSSDQMFTDGRVVLLVSGRSVRAYGLDDGAPRWSARLDEENGGTWVLRRTATDAGTAGPDGGAVLDPDGGWWSVTADGRLAYGAPTDTTSVVVLG
jgi:outer membrane protein assembly factor BamB